MRSFAVARCRGRAWPTFARFLASSGFALSLVAVPACRDTKQNASGPASGPAASAPPSSAGMTIDPVLLQSLCFVSATPASDGGGTAAGVLTTSDDAKFAWFARDYNALIRSNDELERALLLLRNPTPLEQLVPNDFCPRREPVYMSLLVSNATDHGKRGSWIIAGDIRSPAREFVPNDAGVEPYTKAAQMVLKALGKKAHIAQFPERPDVKQSGVDGRWEDAFRNASL